MANPVEFGGCFHLWSCIGMDANDSLYRCAACGLLGDGYGGTWGPQNINQDTTDMGDYAK